MGKIWFLFHVFQWLKNAVLAVLWEEKIHRTAALISIVRAIYYKISEVSLAALFSL